MQITNILKKLLRCEKSSDARQKNIAKKITDIKFSVALILIFFKLKILKKNIITFSYSSNARESIVFRSNFRNGGFGGFTRFEVSLIQKSYL